MDTMDASWTPGELADVRKALCNAELDLRLRMQRYQTPAPECGDDADLADWASRAEFDSLSLERDRVLLEQTGHVIDLIDQGLYGRCETCGSTIPKERLLAYPQATLCLACVHPGRPA